MAKMKVLHPPVSAVLPADGWDLLATQAGRFADGLRGTVQLWNGELKASQQILFDHQHRWTAFINKVVELTGCASEVIEAAILQLGSAIEGALRGPQPLASMDGMKAPDGSPPDDENPQSADPWATWQAPGGEYEVGHGRFFRWTSMFGEPVRKQLSNFVARVVEDITHDDGAEEVRTFVIEGRMPAADGLRPLPRREVAAHHFEGLAWLPKVWGVEPAALPGQREYLAYAIRLFSGQVARRMVYAHLGWRRIEGRWVFLHAGGAIGANGVDVDVSGDALARYSLPSEAVEVRAAMQASLQFLEAGNPRVTYPAWALPWRAVVCEWLPCTVLPHWVGQTGALKSTFAAALLAHFGTFRMTEDLPARWEFTDNILEKIAFLAKDVLCVIDDLNPETTRGRREDLERRFSRLDGSVGNATGRRRMRADTSTRLEYRPRGLVMSTGEYTPTLSQSRLARLFLVPFDEGAIDKRRLTTLQGQLDRLSHAMRGFIQHLQGSIETLPERLRTRFDHLRREAGELGRLHARLPETVAHLYLGLELGLGFAVSIGSLSTSEAETHLKTGWHALTDLAREQGRMIGEERPTQAFLTAISEGLASGKIWLADRQTGSRAVGENNPGNEKLGWADKDGLYLLPSAAFAFASARLSYRGGVHISDRALHKMLEQEGYLMRDPSEPDRLTPKRRCEGRDLRVLWLQPGALGELEQLALHEREYSRRS